MLGERAPAGEDEPRPVRLSELWTDDGEPVAFPTLAPGAPIYIPLECAWKLSLKLSGAYRRQDGRRGGVVADTWAAARAAARLGMPPPDPETLREAVTDTLADARYRTRLGVLTPLASTHRPSVDYPCQGRGVVRWSPAKRGLPTGRPGWVQAVVRTAPPDGAACAGLRTDPDELVNLLITIKPCGTWWSNFFDQQGPIGVATYELRADDCFDPAVHCDWSAP